MSILIFLHRRVRLMIKFKLQIRRLLFFAESSFFQSRLHNRRFYDTSLRSSVKSPRRIPRCEDFFPLGTMEICTGING